MTLPVSAQGLNDSSVYGVTEDEFRALQEAAISLGRGGVDVLPRNDRSQICASASNFSAEAHNILFVEGERYESVLATAPEIGRLFGLTPPQSRSVIYVAFALGSLGESQENISSAVGDLCMIDGDPDE